MTLSNSLKQEALNRIEREVKKAVPEWPDRQGDDLINTLIVNDAEVSCEIKNLIRIIIEEQ